MTIVTEYLDGFPIDDTPPRKLARREELLLSDARVRGSVVALKHDLISVLHFPLHFYPAKFAPPKGIYESDHIRIEWQQMDHFRQPFYHRNADVDEISYQVCGERTLMTEYGTVELRPGDYSRIPVGVAHDNFGRAEIHLLFYVPAPVTDCGSEDRKANRIIPPYQGWEPKQVPEVMTECLGGPECKIAAFQVDELLLLSDGNGSEDTQLLSVIRPTALASGVTEWQYKSRHIWIGHTEMVKSTGDPVYRRHRCANEIQCQISGKRTLITQRGIIQLEEGDFVCIPNGVAFSDIVDEKSVHITVLSFNEAPAKAEIARQAKPTTMAAVLEARQQVGY